MKARLAIRSALKACSCSNALRVSLFHHSVETELPEDPDRTDDEAGGGNKVEQQQQAKAEVPKEVQAPKDTKDDNNKVLDLKTLKK